MVTNMGSIMLNLNIVAKSGRKLQVVDNFTTLGIAATFAQYS